MKRARIFWVVTTLFAMLATQFAKGDGGIVQLRQSQGPFLATIFLSPEAITGGIMDLSVLVQRRDNGEVILDADIGLTVEPPVGISSKQSDPLCGFSSMAIASRSSELPAVKVSATRKQASNKLLYAAQLKLDGTGDWPLHVTVSQGTDSAGFDCILRVNSTSAKLQGVWPYLAFPPIAIIAFTMNQRLRRRSLEQFDSRSDSAGRQFAVWRLN